MHIIDLLTKKSLLVSDFNLYFNTKLHYRSYWTTVIETKFSHVTALSIKWHACIYIHSQLMEVEQTFINKLWCSSAILSTDLNFCTKMLKFQIMFMVIWSVLLFPEWLYYILQPPPPPPSHHPCRKFWKVWIWPINKITSVENSWSVF